MRGDVMCLVSIWPEERNVVTGELEPAHFLDCRVSRQSLNPRYCGMEGRLFEAKEGAN